MQFTPLPLPGILLIQMDRRADTRGYFARSFCADEFKAHGIPPVFPQCNVSFNTSRGTLRGLHWQDDLYPEAKLVRCVRGSVFDVAVDLRPRSASYGKWVSAILSADNGDALYIPPGFAHGFQTMEDGSEVFYQMAESYHGDGLARGLRWNDPTIAVDWPIPDPILSDRDAVLPLLGL
ncbi:MAG: dTDP-4-dehydrorhamnose 3,5-epimerase [Acidiphilium sp. 34-60-192]|nr:MAG: dTDP-4-dehydrorhamnose 3,5-epimerase [Acidiphilium sp. 34-60-192]